MGWVSDCNQMVFMDLMDVDDLFYNKKKMEK